jgi:oligo-1,6-glucosidase
MKFWAEKGIDGFRLDAFQFVAKDTGFPQWPKGYEKNFNDYYSMGPHIHDYLKEMYKEVLSKYNVMSVAEGAGRNFADAHELVDSGRKELNMAYAFDAVDLGKPGGYSLLRFKQVFTRWDSAFAKEGWLSIFLANHDQARLVTRFGNDSPAFREISSKMLTTFILSMRGTPFYYNGDELGMTNPGFTRLEQFRDKATLNEYQHQKAIGTDMVQYLKNIEFSGRDNGRTPFQWDSSTNAGFSSGKSWIELNPDYKQINAAREENDSNSCLNYFRKMVRLRKENPVLVYGIYQLLDPANPDVYAYTRELNGKKWLVVLNFRNRVVTSNTGIDFSKARIMIDNYGHASLDGHLKPYEALLLELP